ncbi:MAG: hypothetical protein M3Z50_13330 [Actinomycetota bacterium]|nr:hypothetical protein [Actinomycetota bacterium]
MTGLWVTLDGVLLVAGVAAWLSWTATRLDALHHRVELARESVRRRLLERSGWTLEMATSGLLDDAEALVLADAAARARAEDRGFEAAESDLSQALRVVFDHAGEAARVRTTPVGTELVAACQRVELARRFHNDAVGSARHVRSRWPVRFFRLAGSAGSLRTIDLDDAPPAGFTSAGASDHPA